MRLISEIPHELFKISVFSWNNKYIIKFENGDFEQTYKISEWDLTSENDVPELVNNLLAKSPEKIFKQMNENFMSAMDEL